MEGKKKISVIGPAIIDVLAGPVSAGIFEQNSTPVKDIRLSFGGNALNETVVLKKLGCEARLVSKVGGDEAGFRILRMLEDQGIGTGNIAMERELATGINIVLYDGSGERRFLTNPDSSLRKLSEADIENSIGLDATNAWLMKKVLELKEKNTGKDLSHLKAEVPNVDMDEVSRKIDEKCKEMMKKKSNDREDR